LAELGKTIGLNYNGRYVVILKVASHKSSGRVEYAICHLGSRLLAKCLNLAKHPFHTKLLPLWRRGLDNTVGEKYRNLTRVEKKFLLQRKLAGGKKT
jgi:hypothetical protein